MPELPEDVKQLISAAVTQARIEFEAHSNEKITALKETFAEEVSKLKENHSSEVANLGTKLSSAEADAAAYNKEKLDVAVAELTKLKPDYNKEKYNTVDKISEFTSMIKEAQAIVNAGNAVEEHSNNAPAQTGGNTTPPIENHSNKSIYVSRHEKAKKDLFDGINR